MLTIRDLRVAASTVLLMALFWLVVTYLVVIIKGLLVLGVLTAVYLGYLLWGLLKEFIDGEAKKEV